MREAMRLPVKVAELLAAATRLAVGVLLVQLPASATVYKCQAEGKTVYRDAPCPGAGSDENKMHVSAAPAEPSTLRPGEVDLARQADLRTAIESRKVMVGMTAEQVRSSWGSPTKISNSVIGGHAHAQWVYRRDKVTTQYVYFEDGKVSGWN